MSAGQNIPYSEHPEYRHSTVHQLPPEILHRIFMFVVGNTGDGSPFIGDSLDSTKGIWVVPQVCGYWRNAALSYAPLWAYLGVSDTSFSRTRWLQHMKLQLERSGVYVSLHISLDFTKHEPKIIDVVGPHFARCISLNLDIPPATIIQLSSLRPGFDTIEVLHISARCGAITAIPFASHHLRELRGTTDRMVSSLQVHWTNITAYELSSPQSATDHTAVLHQMPQLITCSLTFAHWAWKPLLASSIASVIPLPMLQNLRLHSVLPDSADSILLSRLLVPALTTLGVHGQIPLYAVRTFLDNSGCELRRLGLYFHGTAKMPKASDLGSLNLPRIQELEILPQNSRNAVAYVRACARAVDAGKTLRRFRVPRVFWEALRDTAAFGDPWFDRDVVLATCYGEEWVKYKHPKEVP